jgi:hypothetical protein
MSNEDSAASNFVLPEKWSDDIVDENGNKMSKRYVIQIKMVNEDNQANYHAYYGPVALRRVSHVDLHPSTAASSKSVTRCF